MAHSLTTIGVHFECAIQAEMVVELELALIERKQSHRFQHKSHERVRKCAKVKGRYLSKNRQNPEYKPLVRISPNYTIPTPTLSVLTSTYTQILKKS